MALIFIKFNNFNNITMNEYLLNTRAKMLKEDFEDTKRITKIRNSKKDRQHNGQKDNQNP
jgi:hypothetical protein